MGNGEGMNVSHLRGANAMTDPSLIGTADYDEAMDAFIAEAVHTSMSEMDRFYASLRRSPLPEGVRRIRVQVEGAENTSPEVHLSQLVELDLGDVIAGNLERFHEAIVIIAEAHLVQFMGPFFEHLGDVAESVGNALNFGGAEFGWDELLDAYERPEWGVDASGLVHPPQITAGPDVAERLRNLPPPTPEQDERFRLIRLRKQEEHDARRRRRRLR